MTVNSIHNAGNTAAMQKNPMTLSADSYTKNVQQQIANAQKKLQDLSSDAEMTLEEKMKKRQEIQQEITTLQQQLRQHQIEQRKEQQSQNTKNDMRSENRTAGASAKKGTGLSTASMQAMISADSSMKQAEVQGSTATQMEGKTRVLKAEIQADKGRGSNTEAKEAELAELTERVQDTQSAQVELLSNAVKNGRSSVQTSSTNQTRLSSKAQKLLDKLSQTYSDMDFLVADFDKGDDAKEVLSHGTKEFSVVFSSAELEKMASDEKYLEEKMQGVAGAVRMSEQINEQFGFESAFGKTANSSNISKIAISFHDDGTTTFFAELEKASAKQKERIEKTNSIDWSKVNTEEKLTGSRFDFTV